MKILLTNDDGYQAPGILMLYNTLSLEHEVVLVAPDREKSAVGHGITLNQPLLIAPVEMPGGGAGYAVTGTPADCIKLGLFELFDTPPDLVIAGINPGSNTGININYSGTVGAAREAALNGILSMAVSIRVADTLDYQGISKFIARLLHQLHRFDLAPGTFLNINSPGIGISKIKGIRVTRQALDNLSTGFEKRTDPKRRDYYWYGRYDPGTSDPDTDETALLDQCISITPLHCDITDYKAMSQIKTTGLKGLLD